MKYGKDVSTNDSLKEYISYQSVPLQILKFSQIFKSFQNFNQKHVHRPILCPKSIDFPKTQELQMDILSLGAGSDWDLPVNARRSKFLINKIRWLTLFLTILLLRHNRKPLSNKKILKWKTFNVDC